ncbi:MAG TPA: trehalose-phosphatase [Planctomycetota bacterium]|nr:trehalose-phosphatase [Planctomycetota bacterium]
MKHVLADSQRTLLSQVAGSNVLLGFDFDGTLAPIVRDPERAELRPTTRELLGLLTTFYPCVVISGRALHDVERRVAGLGLRAVVGNHGVEPCCATDELRRKIADWHAALAPSLCELQGVELEDKGYSLALHYRKAPARDAAREQILRTLEVLGDIRLLHGKCVVNVLPAGLPDKGAALECERDRAGCDTAFFLGDDDTDEDVFSLGTPPLALSVRVGASPASRAMCCLESQLEVDALLSRLIELRQGAVRERRAT